jgi:UDP-glucose 4-epimerase
MKVLLTGYSGFLGRYLGKALMQEGFSLRVLLHRHTITRRELETEVELIWGTINDLNVIRNALDGVDYVVHSAWAFSSPLEERPTLNEQAANMLFSESVHAGVKKFTFISSVAVYGMNAKSDSLIEELSPLAKGKDLSFIYPSEKIAVERALQGFDRKETALAIFRPGPIFDDCKGPPKKVTKLGRWNFGIGFGNGRNQMAYIHAKDAADAVTRWLVDGKDGSIFNVVSSKNMRSKEWFRAWGQRNNLSLKPVFIPGSIIRLAGFGVKTLKKMLGKQSKADVKYAIVCAKRSMRYSNKTLKRSLDWSDKKTSEYLINY